MPDLWGTGELRYLIINVNVAREPEELKEADQSIILLRRTLILQGAKRRDKPEELQEADQSIILLRCTLILQGDKRRDKPEELQEADQSIILLRCTPILPGAKLQDNTEIRILRFIPTPQGTITKHQDSQSYTKTIITHRRILRGTK